MAKLSNKQLKKLYDYGGTLSPKDWSDMIDNLRPDCLEEAPIVKTTYKALQGLYNEGQILPGVIYEFEYDKPDFKGETMPISLSLHVDSLGKFKVFGNYNRDEVYYRPFYADFEFNAMYIFHDQENDANIYITYNTASIEYCDIDTDLNLSELGFEFIENGWTQEWIIPNVFSWYDEHDIIHIVSRNGTHITCVFNEDDYKWVINLKNTHTTNVYPAIYNIHYGNDYYWDMNLKYNEIKYDSCFHSTFVDNISMTARCDIYGSSIDDYLNWDSINMDGILGIIINSNLSRISDIHLNINKVNIINDIDLNNLEE